MFNHRLLHELADLVDKKCNIWPSKSKVLQGSHNASIKRRIIKQHPIIFEQSLIGKAWSCTRLSSQHVSFAEQVLNILRLGQKQTSSSSANLNPQEIMQTTQIFYFKFSSKSMNNLPNSRLITTRNDYTTYTNNTTTPATSDLTNNKESEYVCLKPNDGRNEVNLSFQARGACLSP